MRILGQQPLLKPLQLVSRVGGLAGGSLDAVPSPNIAQRLLDPASIATKTVVLRLVNPTNDALLVYQEGRRDCHSLETDRVSEGESQNKTGDELEPVAVYKAVLFDNPQLGVGEDCEGESVACPVLARVINTVLADRHRGNPVSPE